ncbi:TPA: undecaprenyldiphospho-muramoylpentapeptide beta-N-acetylglucosaminyltransferase [bacterium]|nr:MAG: undecaprenyldiphospho-muramoylpentapeptide beta-N-acetylglucosaminyltransferase [Candidatus Hydrogenedentes bacterium CG1_02_42_14]HBW47738.1 undecaprenyldiphospho-muramoylpentapeptide beta-N-acetylglucosaminyltransferase [bacterium]
MKEKKLLLAIAGGGTGGHVYPGIAVAEELRNRGGESFFLGTERGLENRIVPKAGFDFFVVEAAPIERKKPWLIFSELIQNLRGIISGRNILQKKRPQALLGTGGYVSFSSAFAAWSLGIPVIINEQNAVPGLANKILSNFAALCISAWEPKENFWKCPVKKIGLPVRKDFFCTNRKSARKEFGLKENDIAVLFFGGSRGSISINRAVSAIAKRLADEKIFIIWGTGTEHFENVMRMSGVPSEKMRILPYIDNMPAALSAADIAVTRSGAMTVAEIAAIGIPSILVPFPYATGDHQKANALKLKESNAAEMICDEEVSEKLYDSISMLINDSKKRFVMSESVRSFCDPDSAKKMADEIEKVIESGAKE